MMYSTNAVHENRKGSDTLNPSDIDDSLTSKQRIPFTAIDAVERYTDNSETSDTRYLKTRKLTRDSIIVVIIVTDFFI